MNGEALFLFIILLLGLVLCSFLGGNCNQEGFNNIQNDNTSRTNYNYKQTSNINDLYNNSNQEYQKGTYINNNSLSSSQYDNYNHYSGNVAPLTNGQVFNGPNGGTITVVTNSDGSQNLQITTASGQTPVIYSNQKPSSTTTEGYTNYSGVNGSATTFYGPNGGTATVINANNGQEAIIVNTTTGTIRYDLATTAGVYNPPGYNPPGTAGVYNPPGYNPPGTAGVYNPPGYNPPGTAGVYNTPGYNPPGTAGVYNPPGYNPPGTAGLSNPPGYNPPGSSSNPWMSSLPPGVPFSQIPPGDEDLYILKSEIVPPVCPACNNSVTQNTQTCPPCKPCGRCEMPPFECKKVPNYAALSDEYQPVPILNNFSGFGM